MGTVRLETETAAFFDAILFRFDRDRNFARGHTDVLACPLPVASAVVDASGGEVDPVNFDDLVVFIWEAVPDAVGSGFGFDRRGLLHVHQNGVHRRRADQLIEADAQSGGDFAQRPDRRVCGAAFDLRQHAFADAGLFGGIVETPAVAGAVAVKIFRYIVFQIVHGSTSECTL